jgi:hypothetical protein
LADALSFTHFNSNYYNLSPEEQDATRVHEDIHLYDPNQFPPLNSSRSREIDATTKEINYINGQIAALTQQQQQELQSDCPSQQRLHDLGMKIFNYGNALANAQANLDYYQSHSNFQILVDALDPF